MKNNSLISFFRWILIVAIPLLLVIGSISILTQPVYLSYEYAKTGFPADSFGFTPQERLSHASDNLRYIRDNLPSVYLEQQNHEGQPLYTPREISHMADVQTVFQITWNAGAILLVLIIFVTIAMTWRAENRVIFFTCIQQAGVYSAGFITVIGLFAVLSWNTWFTIFHQFFFQPGTWTFKVTDTLIRLFPLPFWYDSALTLSALTLGAGILLAILGGYLKNKVSFRIGFNVSM